MKQHESVLESLTDNESPREVVVLSDVGSENIMRLVVRLRETLFDAIVY